MFDLVILSAVKVDEVIVEDGVSAVNERSALIDGADVVAGDSTEVREPCKYPENVNDGSETTVEKVPRVAEGVELVEDATETTRVVVLVEPSLVDILSTGRGVKGTGGVGVGPGPGPDPDPDEKSCGRIVCSVSSGSIPDVGANLSLNLTGCLRSIMAKVSFQLHLARRQVLERLYEPLSVSCSKTKSVRRMPAETSENGVCVINSLKMNMLKPGSDVPCVNATGKETIQGRLAVFEEAPSCILCEGWRGKGSMGFNRKP